VTVPIEMANKQISIHDQPTIFLLEDDADQIDLLASFIIEEIQNKIADTQLNETQKQVLRDIKIAKLTDVQSLEIASNRYSNVILAIMDCNLPDSKGDMPHDQFVRINQRITGQHKPVDILISQLPSTPITLISTLNRFKHLVTSHYRRKHDLMINFINKSDQEMIQRNIAYYLRKYLSTV